MSPLVAVYRTEGHIGERVCPLTILRHNANLQALSALRQGILRPPLEAVNRRAVLAGRSRTRRLR